MAEVIGQQSTVVVALDALESKQVGTNVFKGVVKSAKALAILRCATRENCALEVVRSQTDTGQILTFSCEAMHCVTPNIPAQAANLAIHGLENKFPRGLNAAGNR